MPEASASRSASTGQPRAFDAEQFHLGLNVELEHGSHDPETNVTGNDEMMTGKIAWAHLKEIPDYYTRLNCDGGRGRRMTNRM